MIFDHIGIVVTELSDGRTVLRESLGPRAWTEEFADPVNDVHVQFGRDAAGLCYELIAPFSPKSPVRRALRTGANITNHVAYRVADLASQRERLLGLDFSLVADARPAVAYGGALIQFFMSPVFSLVELIEAPYHEHRYIAED